MSDYGKVSFEGKEYTLTDDAFIDNDSNGGVCYYAYGKNEQGEDVKIKWDLTPEFAEHNEKFARFEQLEENIKYLQSNGQPTEDEENELNELIENDYSIGNEDSGNACDWDNPVEVREI